MQCSFENCSNLIRQKDTSKRGRKMLPIWERGDEICLPGKVEFAIDVQYGSTTDYKLEVR